MTIAAVANSPAELKARERVMANYPHNMRGKMLGLRDFSEQYVRAIRSGLGMSKIIQGTENSSVETNEKIAHL